MHARLFSWYVTAPHQICRLAESASSQNTVSPRRHSDDVVPPCGLGSPYRLPYNTRSLLSYQKTPSATHLFSSRFRLAIPDEPPNSVGSRSRVWGISSIKDFIRPKRFRQNVAVRPFTEDSLFSPYARFFLFSVLPTAKDSSFPHSAIRQVASTSMPSGDLV